MSVAISNTSVFQTVGWNKGPYFPGHHPEPLLWTRSMTSSPEVGGWCSLQATREERNEHLGFLGTETGICSKWWIIQQQGGSSASDPERQTRLAVVKLTFIVFVFFKWFSKFVRVWWLRLKCLQNNNPKIIFTLMSCNYWLFLWSINLAIIFVDSIKGNVKKKI